MTLIVTYGKKIKQTLDMGGFPDEVIVEDKTKIVVEELRSPPNPNFLILYSPIPNLDVLINPSLTEKQIDKALIEYLNEKIKEDMWDDIHR